MSMDCPWSGALLAASALLFGCEAGVEAAPAGGGASPSAGAAAFGGAIGGVAGAGLGGAGGEAEGGGGAGAGAPRVLVFSKTAAFRHTSIEPGVVALKTLASDRGLSLTVTEDASVFSEDGLLPYDVVLFLSTTGDVLDDPQQAALEGFIRGGHGFVGVHAASDTEYDWAWYGGLVGAYFREHPAVQSATLLVEDATHPSTAHLGATWARTDEWYAFQSNPRGEAHVLLALDESSYDPGPAHMGGDHPVSWYHEYDGGRAFYTALGHTDESYSEPDFMEHLAGAIYWAAGTTKE